MNKFLEKSTEAESTSYNEPSSRNINVNNLLYNVNAEKNIHITDLLSVKNVD